MADVLTRRFNGTQQTKIYPLKNHIEPEFSRALIRAVTPLTVTDSIKALNLGPTTMSAIRSALSQCFKLASLHAYIAAMERSPIRS